MAAFSTHPATERNVSASTPSQRATASFFMRWHAPLEGLRLRVYDAEFTRQACVVRAGKGGEGRITVLRCNSNSLGVWSPSALLAKSPAAPEASGWPVWTCGCQRMCCVIPGRRSRGVGRSLDAF